MHRPSLAFTTLALAMSLAGCAGMVPGFLGNLAPTPSPSYWWEENPTQLANLLGPTTAQAGTPVVLSARVIIGSGSCDRFKSLSATVDEPRRTVTLSATRESKRAAAGLACTDDFGSRVATVSVTLGSAGSYLVKAERFHGAAFSPDEIPRATYDLVVQAPGAPTYWWEPHAADMTSVSGPATATAGVPIVLTARVVVGSSSCDRLKALNATVDAASRSVVLSAVVESRRAAVSFGCTGDFGTRLATVSVTLPVGGPYLIKLDRFQSIDMGETPRASMDLVAS